MALGLGLGVGLVEGTPVGVGVGSARVGSSVGSLSGSVDGSVDDNWMKGAIEFTQKTLGGAAKEVPPSQVFDFSFVQKAVK